MAEKRYIEKFKINDWWYWFKSYGQVDQLIVDGDYLSPVNGIITVPLTVNADGITYEKVNGPTVTAPSITFLLENTFTDEESTNFANAVFEEAWV